MSDPDPILEAARAWLNRTFVMRLMDPGLDQSLADLLREQRREGARDAGVAIVKRCCPDCCEHCYNTALEAQKIAAGDYRRGRVEGAREMRERARQYVATHYPVHRTSITSEWVMEKNQDPSDGGKVQEAYAKALAALPDELEVSL